MKAELERIWNEEPLAWALNIAGWSKQTVRGKFCKLIGKLFTFKGKRNRVTTSSRKSKKATR